MRIGLVLLGLVVAASAQDAATGIAFNTDLTAAFAEAKKEQKILMICVNAKFVDGRKTKEPANKGLREVIYKNSKVIEKSREFVCALVTPASGSTQFGELRMLGIEGDLISPQHIFVHPDGKKILLLKEYWSHGKGEEAVKVMLDLMASAQKKFAASKGEAAGGEAKDPGGAPAAGAEREAWIVERMGEVKGGNQDARRAAITALLQSDKDGDCTTPLITLLAEEKKNVDVLIDVIRGLGKDGLHTAAPAVVAFLTHKDDDLRGHAAVSLEYIGSKDKNVVAAIQKAAGREKNEDIASHMFRALGRCGAGESKVRAFLLKKAGGAKSEFASYGPAIGLAYFTEDAKAARGMEKLIKKVGLPGGRRGGGQNTVKRGVFCWTLANIGDPKSEKFVQEELIDKLANVQAFWVGGLRSFYRQVKRACAGETEALDGIAAGVRGFAGFAKNMNPDRYDREARSMMDLYRRNRNDDSFTPLGDGLLGSSRQQ